MQRLEPMRKGYSLLFLLLCSAVVATAQESTPLFVLRIDHYTNDERTCTVVTKDGKLRVERSALGAGGGHPSIREDIASTDDVHRARAIAANLERLGVDKTVLGQWKNHSNVMILGMPVWSIEFEKTDKPGTLVFAQDEKHAPDYVRDVISFERALGKRKLPKVSAKAESMCTPYHPEEILGPPPKDLQP